MVVTNHLLTGMIPPSRRHPRCVCSLGDLPHPTGSGSYNCSMVLRDVYDLKYDSKYIVRNYYMYPKMKINYLKSYVWVSQTAKMKSHVYLVDLGWIQNGQLHIATKLRTFVFPFRAFRFTRGSPARWRFLLSVSSIRWKNVCNYGWSTYPPK